MLHGKRGSTPEYVAAMQRIAVKYTLLMRVMLQNHMTVQCIC